MESKFSKKEYCLKKKSFLFIIGICISFIATSQDAIIISKSDVQLINTDISYYLDSTNHFTITNFPERQPMMSSEKGIINFYNTKFTTYWFHFKLINKSNSKNLLLEIDYALLDTIEFYQIRNKEIVNVAKAGFHSSLNKKYSFQNPIFDLNLKQGGDSSEYFIKIRTNAPLFFPLKIGSSENILKNISFEDFLTAFYIGIIVSFFFYNLFIYFTVKDKSFIYYNIYIFFMGLTQITLLGYTWRFFWPNNPDLNNYATIVFPSIAGIASIGFIKIFLEIKKYFYSSIYIFNIGIGIYIIAILLVISNQFYYSYRTVDINVFFLAIFTLLTTIIIAKKGSRPAIFYLISWTALIVSLIIFGLRNFGNLPYNNFTSYSLYFGSAIQAILLSIALADRINIYKKEKETSQAYALKVSLENETLIREQNVVLESRVAKRTEELQITNQQLNKTLVDLKDAQLQLVEQEKMAGLGQLTAGIAHEINNPINFVKANITPLRLDINEIFEIIEDYNSLHESHFDNISGNLKDIYEKQQILDINYVKAEIQQLIQGIEDGASRTAEIVKGLQTFSRLDESELKTVNLHEGIKSTIVLLRNNLPYYIILQEKFHATGNIECFAGKLNQVFMNVINNAIQAITAKKIKNEHERISITTHDKDNSIVISVKDTGIGMTEEVKHRIFEPFFTTKPVGEGTGLGMAIVFKIIEQHFGNIHIISHPQEGTELSITLPYIHPVSLT